MDPDLEPIYKGIMLTTAGLATAAAEIIGAGGEPNG